METSKHFQSNFNCSHLLIMGHSVIFPFLKRGGSTLDKVIKTAGWQLFRQRGIPKGGIDYKRGISNFWTPGLPFGVIVIALVRLSIRLLNISETAH